MNSSRFPFLVAILTVILLFTLAVPTASARHRLVDVPDAPPADTKKVVKSVNVAAGTIEIEFMQDKATHAYKVDGGTMIKVNNSPGKITDIKVGMEVSEYVERAPLVLDSISVTGSGSAP